jgi:two-component sensor histidine kinase/ActR/RegA family two-component response regulator
MAELDHRVRNMLATILAMVRISSGHAATKQELAEALTGRITAMGRTHGRLTASGWRGVGLRQIVEDELQPYAGEGRVLVEQSRDVVLPPKDAVNLSLVLHELATNAVKYGALSSDDGRVEIGWTQETGESGAAPCVRLAWRERGGPPVEPPNRRGFGTTIVRSAFRGGEGADVDLRFEPEGVTCEILLPLREAVLAPLSAPPAPRPERQGPERPLAGRRVLLVEDEPTVRLEMVEALEQAGATVVGPAADLPRGMALAAAGGFDLALLDINLEGESVDPLALALHARGVPLVFLTGYRNLSLLSTDLRHLPRLQKPAAPAEVVALLAAAGRQAGQGTQPEDEAKRAL